MNKILIILSSIALVVTSCTTDQQTEQMKRPNIVFILTDDHSCQAISAYGSVLDKTPNLDRIAQNGVIFNQCFVGNSLCAPSRATLLTGLHSHAHGMMTNWTSFSANQQTLPRLLKQAGYKTALFGKWHLHGSKDTTKSVARQVNPTKVGIDEWSIMTHNGGQGTYYKPLMIDHSGKRTVHEGYISEVVTKLSLDWLKENKNDDKPFFLMVNHKATHSHWTPSPEQISNLKSFTEFENKNLPEPETLHDDFKTRTVVRSFRSSKYKHGRNMVQVDDLLKENGSAGFDMNLSSKNNPNYGLMSPEQQKQYNAAYKPRRDLWKKNKKNWSQKEKRSFAYQCYIKDYLRTARTVDKSVGQILDYLEANNMDDNTIIIYASDQGYFLGEHGYFNKQWIYEPSLRTPFLMQWKGSIPTGKKVNAMVQNIDWAPTLLEAAGVAPKTKMHGKSFLKLANGLDEGKFREAVYYHYRHPNGPPPHFGLRTDTYKLAYFYDLGEKGEWELYNIIEDPNEVNNLLAKEYNGKYKDIKTELVKKLKAIRKEYGDKTGRTL